MQKLRAGVVGASGYSGGVLARLLACHPDIEVSFLTSDKLENTPARDHLGMDVPLSFVSNASASARARETDVVFLATSAEVSAKLAPKIAEDVLTIDLSGAFRLPASAYPEWYGFEHPAPSAFESAFYGLPEIRGAPPRRGIIANPGCYATAAILALAPLVRDGLIAKDGIIADGLSGASGAGRRATEPWSFVEVEGDARAYKLLAHQHTPEMALGIGVPKLTFTPHVVPLRRGILMTCYARIVGDPGALRACLEKAYHPTRFVRVVEPEAVTIHAVAGTAFAYISCTAKHDVVVVVSAIDNLLKGAASQAVQNMNLAFGLPEDRGLLQLQRFAP